MALSSEEKKAILTAEPKKPTSLSVQMFFMVFFCLFIGFGFTMGSAYANYLIGIWS